MLAHIQEENRKYIEQNVSLNLEVQRLKHQIKTKEFTQNQEGFQLNFSNLNDKTIENSQPSRQLTLNSKNNTNFPNKSPNLSKKSSKS